MKGGRDGIIGDVVWCVACMLGTGFYGDAYGMKLGIDEIIEIYFHR